jgi:NAD-reducing hydrogenase large subunit
MNEAVNFIARNYMTGQSEISEPMMNAVEVGIRAYDPCLSCATHAFGQMPLEVSLFNSREELIDRKMRG